MCPRCGDKLLETHTIQEIHADVGVEQTTRAVGKVRMCSKCDHESWLFTSHMPSTVAARKRDQGTRF